VAAKVGDWIVVDSEKAGKPAREGEVLEVLESSFGTRYRVRWADGHESTFKPFPGCMEIRPRETTRSAAG
jgi:hypothetical protein